MTVKAVVTSAFDPNRTWVFEDDDLIGGRAAVTPATRSCDRDTFHSMTGHTIAQTVAMKIDGMHAPRRGAHGTRMDPAHWRAVY